MSSTPEHRRRAADLVVCAPLRIEAWAVDRGPLRGSVLRTGLGPRRSADSLRARYAHRPAEAVAVVGFAGALVPGIGAGDVIVATEVRGQEQVVSCPSAELLARALRGLGLRVHLGPVATTDHVVHDTERRRLAETGAVAVDMESAALARAARGAPLIVVRAVVDVPGHQWASPRTLARGGTALRALRQIGPALAQWADAVAPRTVLLASPRSFCAGVERAIEIVERALDQHEPPIYVRKQIVHNIHVVRDLERRGAIFVDELNEVPAGATVVFSAHGVSPAVRAAADERELRVIDATCPLVTKVHSEARRFARRGDTVVFIGHAGHEETEGTLGEAPDRTVLVENVEDVARLDPRDGRISYLMQTTLAADEAQDVVEALRERFPDLDGPTTEDICYATTNRQDALRDVARDADVVLVVGSSNSSNSRRLVEIAQRRGTPAHLIDGAGDIDLAWLRDARTVGLTAGASSPPPLVTAVVDALRGLGPVEVMERQVATESVRFTLPKEVRP